MLPRFVTATVGGQTYRIPEMWLVGATQRMTYPQAIAWWVQQEEMERAFMAQQTKAA